MFRKIIRPTSDKYYIRIPKEYINQEVEILVLPLMSFKNNNYQNSEIKAFSNHSANTINEWKDSLEDEIWN